jgi:hypothetical protein
MGKNGRERPFRVLKMRATGEEEKGEGTQQGVWQSPAAAAPGRCHDGIMTACRLQCIGLEGEVVRCEELGELLTTEQ